MPRGKLGLILVGLLLAVVLLIGCEPQEIPPEEIPPPEYWRFTDEVATTDQGLNFRLMAAPFLAKGEQWQCSLFYVVLAPEELYGWQVSPTGILISDDQGQIFTGQGNALESVSGVTLGAMPLPLFRNSARFLKIAFNTMEARDLATGGVRELKGNWELTPLKNLTPGYYWEGVLGLWETDEVSYKRITVRYIINGDYVWLSGKWGEPPWVLKERFWLNAPEPHDIFVLVTSEGEVRRVSAEEYQQLGKT
jgi:hypothetical protein